MKLTGEQLDLQQLNLSVLESYIKESHRQDGFASVSTHTLNVIKRRFEELLSSEQAWKEEAIERNEYFNIKQRQVWALAAERDLLEKKLNQAIEVLDEVKKELMWGDAENAIERVTTKIDIFLSSLKEDKT